MEPEIMTTQEVADYLRVPVQTLYAWRTAGTGPKGSRVGRHVRFRRSEVLRWLADQEKAGAGGASVA